MQFRDVTHKIANVLQYNDCIQTSFMSSYLLSMAEADAGNTNSKNTVKAPVLMFGTAVC